MAALKRAAAATAKGETNAEATPAPTLGDAQQVSAPLVVPRAEPGPRNPFKTDPSQRYALMGVRVVQLTKNEKINKKVSREYVVVGVDTTQDFAFRVKSFPSDICTSQPAWMNGITCRGAATSPTTSPNSTMKGIVASSEEIKAALAYISPATPYGGDKVGSQLFRLH